MTSLKNYGVWIRYQSRTGFHNAYKEYREVKRDNTIQFLGVKEPVSFPVVNKVLRSDSKSQKTTFKYKRPNFSAF